MNGWRRSLLGLLGGVAVLTAGCERVMRDMYDQPRLQRGDASPLFRDRLAMRPPPPGSIVRTKGDLAAMSSGQRGEERVDADRASDTATSLPDRPSRAQLLRGQERYSIHCLPCHGPTGEGDGTVVRRGFPHPPSFHLARLIDAPDQHLLDVIRHGWGVMPSYSDRVAPSDREAIAIYVRALQLSQRAPVDDLPDALRSALLSSARGSTSTKALATPAASTTPAPTASAAASSAEKATTR
jgi:mono/diheme cytochrome c family protein